VVIPFHLRKQFTFPHRTLEQWLNLFLPEPFVPAYNWYQKWVVPIYCDWSSRRFVNMSNFEPRTRSCLKLFL